PTCRLHIKEVSSIHPRLEANNIRFVGIGVEQLGVEDFVKGEFFSGELYIDLKKQCYKDLGFRRLNIFSGIGALFAKTTRDGLAKAKEQNIDGNMKGDGFQNGGALIVKAGGTEVIYSYKQEDPSIYVSPNDILKALGLAENTEESKVEEASGGG
ncbi:prostamide/prostaglandin F synthase-like, partial [Ostrea edulis]|uniref:prostamide/prostaglandin F synthase-like n=1 Tax=Ostrea edulis TaxID=37623 RepID=UPI0024AF8A67